MMVHTFYLIVKVMAVIYIMYKIFRFLFGKQGQSHWYFLTPKVQEKKETAVSQPVPHLPPYSIIGKSQTVYLEEPPKVEPPEPVFSEDLQYMPAYEEEQDITPADVDDSLQRDVLTPKDRFLPLDTVEDNERASTGMTYEQISLTIEAVQGKKMNDADRLAAAHTLYDVQGSDLFDFLAMQAENEAAIERLLKEIPDDAGKVSTEYRVAKRKKTEDFDMDRYV